MLAWLRRLLFSGHAMKATAIRSGEVYESASGRFTYIVEDVRNGDVYYECPEEGRRGQAPAEEFAARVARRVPVELLPER